MLATKAPFLSVRGIRKSFGQVEVLHGVDLDLTPGTVTALLGENGAGKSTFVRILAGDHEADSGQILIDGNDPGRLDVARTKKLGVRLITQEISDAPPLTVAENIALGEWPSRTGIVDRKAMQQNATRALASLGSDIDPKRKAETLRLGERQLVEIARAIVGESRCVILDEPTAALSDAETRQLFTVIEGLKSRGVAVLYITHRLDEVFAIADRAVVLRDGVISLNKNVSETNTAEVIEAMVGHAVAGTRFGPADPGTVHDGGMELHSVTGVGFDDVSFDIPAGRVTALYGKIGSGVAEIAEALFGARAIASGRVLLNGQESHARTPAAAIAAGIGYLPPDRKGEALLPGRSVAENLAAPSWARLAAARFFVSHKTDATAYKRWHNVLGVRSRNDPRQSISTLSGGNQQKVLLGRWLEAGSKVLILTEPTRGVDVGARQEIYQVLRQLADSGASVLIATSDYEDVVATADVAHVFIRGQLVASIPESRITIDSLTTAAGGAHHE